MESTDVTFGLGQEAAVATATSEGGELQYPAQEAIAWANEFWNSYMKTLNQLEDPSFASKYDSWDLVDFSSLRLPKTSVETFTTPTYVPAPTTPTPTSYTATTPTSPSKHVEEPPIVVEPKSMEELKGTYLFLKKFLDIDKAVLARFEVHVSFTQVMGYTIFATVKGDRGPWKGFAWPVEITITKPWQHPLIRSPVTIFHPNCFPDGQVVLDSWRPTWDLRLLLIELEDCLHYPRIENIGNQDANDMYWEERESYDAYVKSFVTEHLHLRVSDRSRVLPPTEGLHQIQLVNPETGFVDQEEEPSEEMLFDGDDIEFEPDYGDDYESENESEDEDTKHKIDLAHLICAGFDEAERAERRMKERLQEVEKTNSLLKQELEETKEESTYYKAEAVEGWTQSFIEKARHSSSVVQ